MSPRTYKLALAVVAALVFAGLVALALRWERILEQGLPPREVCASQADALSRAQEFARGNGGAVLPILGTGSMAPFIPAGEATGIVAYAVTDPARAFENIEAGDLCIYRAEWLAGALVIHQAAARDGAGWIMTGLHNSGYESRYRVTQSNFVGVVARVYVIAGN